MNKKVRIYYGGISSKNKKPEKYEVLHEFHRGIYDGESKEISERVWEPADLAVIQGWIHEKSQNSPHLQFRKEIIDKQKEIGGRTLAIDSNLFLYRDPDNTQSYLRFSLDGVFPTTGEYFIESLDPKRWKKIKNDIGIDLQPWRKDGDHILVCLQRNGGWSMGSIDVHQWLKKTLKRVRSRTQRPIFVRPHPGDRKTAEDLVLNKNNVYISNRKNIVEDFRDCWATITFNSSPGVASAIEGIPVFVTDNDPKRSQAYDVANLGLKNIAEPEIFNRKHWIEKLSMCHFNFEDLRNGTAWDIIKKYL